MKPGFKPKVQNPFLEKLELPKNKKVEILRSSFSTKETLASTESSLQSSEIVFSGITLDLDKIQETNQISVQNQTDKVKETNSQECNTLGSQEDLYVKQLKEKNRCLKEIILKFEKSRKYPLVEEIISLEEKLRKVDEKTKNLEKKLQVKVSKHYLRSEENKRRNLEFFIKQQSFQNQNPKNQLRILKFAFEHYQKESMMIAENAEGFLRSELEEWLSCKEAHLQIIKSIYGMFEKTATC